MVKNKDRWSALSMSERADLIKLYVSNGITSLNDIKRDYNSFAPGGPIETDEYGYPADITPAVIEADYPRENEVWKRADASNADMIQRLKQGSSRATIQDWEDPRKVATHKMMSAGNYVVGNVQNINGQLFDFTDPKHGFENPDRAAIDSAIKRGDYIKFDTEGDARYFAEHYKKHYNSFGDGGEKEPLYYDNTPIEPAVIKAFNSQEDYNRYYGEQFGKQILKKRDDLLGTYDHLFDPQKIADNVPARQWGPMIVTDENVLVMPGTNTVKAPIQYLVGKNTGKNNIELAKQIIDDFEAREDKQKHIDENSNYYMAYIDAKAYLDHAEGLKKYLGLPYDNNSIKENAHKPTRLQGTDEKTYKFTSQESPKYWKDVVEDMVLGEQKEHQYYDPTLNTFTAYRDIDNKGDFISIYDEWDYNPSVQGGSKHLNKIIDVATGGNPFIVYDRIYLDDYYDVPEAFRGNPYITPAVVTAGSKKANGGKLSLLNNSFGDGGDTEGAGVENDIPTLDAYLQMKLQEARQMALANSYNATEPRLAKKYYTEEDYNDLSDKISYKEDDINLTKHSISVLENKLYNPILLYKGIGQINPRLRYKGNKLKDYGEQLIDELDDLYNYLNNDEKELINYNDRLKFAKENGYDWSGYNCITNASGWYGDDYVCASNIQFAKDPTKYGFIEINPNDALPGDIFQYLGNNNIPTHATMYSKKNDKGEVLTNYAPGSYNRKIQKDSGYYSTGDRAFRFVGLPKDIEAWTQEYNEKYKNSKEGTNNHSNGGKINRFDIGGPTREMTPSEAAAINKTLNSSQYMLAVGDSPDDPTYLSTDLLEPAVVKAFNSEEDYNRYQGEKFGEYVSNEISEAGTKLAPVLVGAAATPWAISGGIAAYTNPVTKSIIDLAGSIDGIRNAASKNGVRKTIRLAKEGDVWGTTKSAIGDIFDIAGGIGLAGDVYRYGKGASKRLAEAVVRIGDNAPAVSAVIEQILNKKALNYIFNPYADPNLAYNLPYTYSGVGIGEEAYKGDVVDKFFRKVPVVDSLDPDSIPSGLKSYISDVYPHKDIKYIDLGSVKPFGDYKKKVLQSLQTGESIKYGEKSGGIYKRVGFFSRPVLDPGGFNSVYKREGNDLIHEGFDIWKFNADDYMKRYSPTTEISTNKKPKLNDFIQKYKLQKIIPRLGLKFIDSMGDPIVHKFTYTYPNFYK